MKIAYFLIGKYEKENGVYKKIKSQIECWQQLGHTVKIFHLSISDISIFQKDNNAVVCFANNILFHSNIIYNEIKLFNPNIVYCRYVMLNYHFYRLMKNFKVISEINSDDIQEYKNDMNNKFNIKYIFKYYYNLLSHKLFFKNIVGAVFVSFELREKEKVKESIVLENTLDLKNFKLKRPHRSKIPQLLFIGSPGQEWHGIDKLIYLAHKTIGKLEFHVIGIDKNVFNNLPINVNFYGYLKSNDYMEIFRKCDIGIGTLALHRNKMNEASPLKTREYLVNGLPIIIGYNDTSIIKSKINLPFILNIGNYENNVIENIDEIVDFSYKMKDVSLDRNMITNFDIKNIERQRIKFFEKICLGE